MRHFVERGEYAVRRSRNNEASWMLVKFCYLDGGMEGETFEEEGCGDVVLV